ncbi:MAG: efflux RND transporter periplasmic adaptor subunit [Bacteroidales bacterium]|nr:efflux RND transporter periplasmic adaptor subunit [Bacteroidales bacterium]
MKIIRLFSLLLSFGILFISCSTNEIEEKKDNLQKKKEELATLKVEIKTLETELKSLIPETTEKGTAVNVLSLTPQAFSHSFEVNASLEAVQSALVSPEMGGQVVEILVKEGDKVKSGQLLAKLNTRVLESSIKELRVALDLANKVYNKQQKLWKQKIGSEMDFLTAKNGKESLEAKLSTLQTQLEMAVITSPINGIVDKITLKVGEMATPGMAMMHIVNLDEFYLHADVAEAHLASLKVGDPVEIYFPSFPKLNKKSKIYRIGQVINPENRSFLTEVKLKNTNGFLKPNMLALTRFIDFYQKDAIVVPTSIIKNDFKGSYLYIVQQKEGAFFAKKTYVETGYTMENKTNIISGLGFGQQIITEGYNKIVDGSKLVIL